MAIFHGRNGELSLITVTEVSMPRYLTTAEVAGICRTSPETIRFWRYAGKGPAWFRVGRKVLYDADVFEAWLGDQQNSSSERRAS
jgi:hypothetical protein